MFIKQYEEKTEYSFYTMLYLVFKFSSCYAICIFNYIIPDPALFMPIINIKNINRSIVRQRIIFINSYF